eukprot:3420926-Amphidinium_carterae.1
MFVARLDEARDQNLNCTTAPAPKLENHTSKNEKTHQKMIVLLLDSKRWQQLWHKPGAADAAGAADR